MTGASEWATRGGMPENLLRHVTDGVTRLPEGISFRVWWKEGTTYEYEAVNLGDEAKTWKLERWNGGELAELTVPAHESLKGSVTL